MSPDEIPFNRPYYVGTESQYIEAAVRSGWISTNGEYSHRCQAWIEATVGCRRALLTHSCTGALEAAGLLAELGPGDEVILPSYTFVTTASSIALRGATPVFVDIRADTLNMDETLIEEAITPRTKAIVPVHYAGVGCEMDEIMRIADQHGLSVIEDAAQGLLASYQGRPLGSIGHFGSLSFHETKNVTCGEGGALLVNDPADIDQAEVVWAKGTNRAAFSRGEVEWYSWVALGSSFGLGEVGAAFLWAQLERATEITGLRMRIWRHYHEAFEDLEREGLVRRPRIASGCEHNAHMYYLLLPDAELRARFIAGLAEHGVRSVFHYVPLHSSPAGSTLGRPSGSMRNTDELSARLVRLPLWAGMGEDETARVIEATCAAVDR